MHFSLKYQFNIFFYFLSPSSPFSPMIHYHASRRGNKPSDGRIFERYGRWIFHVSRDDLLSRGNRLLIHRVSRCGSKGTDRLFEGFAIPFDSQKLDPLSRGLGGWPWMTLIPLIPLSLSLLLLHRARPYFKTTRPVTARSSRSRFGILNFPTSATPIRHYLSAASHRTLINGEPRNMRMKRHRTCRTDCAMLIPGFIGRNR